MKSFIKVSFLISALTGLKMLIGLIMAKSVSLIMGPTGVAYLGQTQSVVGIINGLVTAPVNNGIIKTTSELYESDYYTCAGGWTAALRVSLAISVILSIVLVIFRHEVSFLAYKKSEFGWVIMLIAFAAPTYVLNTLIPSVLNGLQKIKELAVFGILGTMVGGVSCLIAIIKYQFTGVLVAVIALNAITGLCYLFFTNKAEWRKLKYWFSVTKKSDYDRTLTYTVMAVVTALLMPLSQITTRLILASSNNWGAVGYWQAVSRISDAYLVVITTILSTYYLPKLSKVPTGISLVPSVSKITKYVVLSTTGAALIIYILRYFLLSLLYSSKFQQAAELFKLQLIGDILKMAAWCYSYTFIARGNSKIFISTEVFYCVAFPSISLFLCPNYGIRGVCLSYIITNAIYLLICMKLFYANESKGIQV